MSITEAQSQQKYLSALNHLIAIGGSINADRQLRRAAGKAIVKLSRDFINVRLSMIELRHQQIKTFITEMERVIAAAEDVDTPFKALTRLTDLVDSTSILLEESLAEAEAEAEAEALAEEVEEEEDQDDEDS